MNPEQLLQKASLAISVWQKHHSSRCFLDIQHGKVLCIDTKNISEYHPDCLIITTFQQAYGFTPSQWTSIRTALLNLYNKEVACQARQKP